MSKITVSNPMAASLKAMGKQVVRPKKGKGSYNRKGAKKW